MLIKVPIHQENVIMINIYIKQQIPQINGANIDGIKWGNRQFCDNI